MDDSINKYVKDVLRTRPSSFAEFVSRLPGIYPATALDILIRKVRSSVLTKKLIADASCPFPLQKTTKIKSKLPVPHPLDYDWRFSGRTVDELATGIMSS